MIGKGMIEADTGKGTYSVAWLFDGRNTNKALWTRKKKHY